MPIQKETPGQTKDGMERLYLSAGLGMSWCPPRAVGGSGLGEEHLDLPAQAVTGIDKRRTNILKVEILVQLKGLSYLEESDCFA